MTAVDPELLAILLEAGDDEAIERVVASMPPEDVQALLGELGGVEEADAIPATPAAQACELDPSFIPRPHLEYLSDRIAAAVADVERGISRRIVVSMPPRHGKSTLGTIFTPVWLLRKHPDWKVALISHSPALASSWGREIRRTIEQNGDKLGVYLARDARAVTEWETTRGGSVVSRSIGQSLTGKGAKVLLIDDPVKDMIAALSEPARDAVWEKWQSDWMLRLEGATLVVAIMTRWHEADLIGRLLSTEYAGDPNEWEQIVLPAFADENDLIGRAPGEPLLSPLIPDETLEQATERFQKIREGLSSYQWAALFDQRPAPAAGAVFNFEWWRYWTRNPARATEDGRVRYLDPEALRSGRVVTSWDATFKDSKSSDYVVGQRWARIDANRFLLDQVRDRMSFTATIAAMKAFMTSGIGAALAHEHLVEDKANGPAIIDSLRDEIAGLKPVNPRGSKEARAEASTPEIESGNVYLPMPDEAPWVNGLLDELRSFPTGKHDDQVDTLTQALDALRSGGRGGVVNPANAQRAAVPPGAAKIAQARTLGTRASAARTMRRPGGR